MAKFKLMEEVLIPAFGVLGTVEMMRTKSEGGTEYLIKYPTRDYEWEYNWFDEMELR